MSSDLQSDVALGHGPEERGDRTDGVLRCLRTAGLMGRRLRALQRALQPAVQFLRADQGALPGLESPGPRVLA